MFDVNLPVTFPTPLRKIWALPLVSLANIRSIDLPVICSRPISLVRKRLHFHTVITPKDVSYRLRMMIGSFKP